MTVYPLQATKASWCQAAGPRRLHRINLASAHSHQDRGRVHGASRPTPVGASVDLDRLFWRALRGLPVTAGDLVGEQRIQESRWGNRFDRANASCSGRVSSNWPARERGASDQISMGLTVGVAAELRVQVLMTASERRNRCWRGQTGTEAGGGSSRVGWWPVVPRVSMR